MVHARIASNLILTAASVDDEALRRRLAKSAATLTAVSKSADIADATQMGLDAAGLVPGYGEIFDAINALISLIRGDYLGAALSVISMVPAAGDAVGKGGKLALWVSKLAKKEGQLGKAGKYLVQQGPKLKAAVSKFSKFVVENKKQILRGLQLLTQLVRASQQDPEKIDDSSLSGTAAKMVAKNPKLRKITEQAEPHIGKVQHTVLSLIQLAAASDEMFAKLEERARQESGAV